MEKVTFENLVRHILACSLFFFLALTPIVQLFRVLVRLYTRTRKVETMSYLITLMDDALQVGLVLFSVLSLNVVFLRLVCSIDCLFVKTAKLMDGNQKGGKQYAQVSRGSSPG